MQLLMAILVIKLFNNLQDVAKLLVSRFTIDEINLKNNGGGNTALHWAALNGHKEIVTLLMASGANYKVIITLILDSESSRQNCSL